MNAEISQQIALVGFGNAYLNNALSDTGLSLDHPAFTGVDRIAFVGVREEDPVAGSAPEWLAQLKLAGVHRMELLTSVHEVDGMGARHVAGFANAPQKMILARGTTGATLWRSEWSVVPQETGHNTWSVSYARRTLDAVGDYKPSPDVHVCLDALVNALQGCLAFCKNNGLDDWAKFFHDAATFQPDEKSVCLPEVGYDIDAHHLVRMGQRAWCFGGMGSWNDQVFNDDVVTAEYEKVSEALFRVLLISSAAAANSFKD